MPPRYWSAVWKKGLWIRRLSGATLEPSIADDLADAWISSLRASRASRIQPPALDEATTTSERSGPDSSTTSEPCVPPWSSWRTSPLFSSISSPLENGYRAWATGIRQAYSARRKSGPRISESDSSSFATGPTSWPTPDASVSNDAESPSSFEARRLRNLAKGINGNGMGTPLAMTAKQWPTPEAGDAMRGDDSNAQRMGSPTLVGEVARWRTPGDDSQRGAPTDPFIRRQVQGHMINLQDQVAFWQTPWTDSFRSRGGERKDEQGLDQQTRGWPTPLATDARAMGGWESRENGREVTLNHAAQTWPTPRAGDRGPAQSHAGTEDALENRARSWPTPQALSAPNSNTPGQDPLAIEAKAWPTPIAGDSERTTSTTGKAEGETPNLTLPGAAKQWHTPRAGAEHFAQPALTDWNDLQAQAVLFRPDPPTDSDGSGPSLDALISSLPWTLDAFGRSGESRRLNPLFTTWLMGLPPQWTCVSMPCGPLETEWWLSRLRWRLWSLVGS